MKKNFCFSVFRHRSIQALSMAGLCILLAIAAPAQIVTTIAGGGGLTGDGVPATAAYMFNPGGVAIDGAGNVYISISGEGRVRKVDAAGIVTTIAGTGATGFFGDGGPATAAIFSGPGWIALDGSGNIFIVDGGNARIRKINTAGIITTVAGTGTLGYSGDGGPATAANIYYTTGLFVDGTGIIYLSDNNRIRKISPAGIITTFAGTGILGYTGDGVPATTANIHQPMSITGDAMGNIYFLEPGNIDIRKVNTSGIISTVAGHIGPGSGSDGIPATASTFDDLFGLAIDAAGNMYFNESHGGG